MKHPPETEAGFQAAVLEYAQLRGWMTYHTHDSRRSAAGFPDLVLVRGGELVLAELKSEKGKVTPEQESWLAALAVVEAEARGQVEAIEGEWTAMPPPVTVRSFIWRPSDWNTIEKELK